MAFEKIKVANPIVEMDGKISLTRSLRSFSFFHFILSDLLLVYDEKRIA